jgi:hypothetical protein
MNLEEKAREFISLFRVIRPQLGEVDDVVRELPPGRRISAYGHLYELSIHQVVNVIVNQMGLSDLADATLGRGDPNANIFGFARDAEPDVDMDSEQAWMTLVFMRVLFRNLEAMAHFFMPVSDLIEMGATGDDDSILHAVRIDASVLQLDAVKERVSTATFYNDDSFLRRLSGAIEQKQPARPKDHLDELRLLLYFLDDAGELEGMSDATLTEWVVDKLGILPNSGDPIQVVKRQRRKLDKARGRSNSDSSDSHLDP